MTHILDQVARDRREFRPETTHEFFALQLARKLKDIASVRSYVDLVERFPEDLLLALYRRILDRGAGDGLANRFRLELRQWKREQEEDDDDETIETSSL